MSGVVLALVYLGARRGAGGAASVGLGRMPLGRLLLVAAAGIVAFRLTTGLTEVVFNSIFTRITGPAFSWYIYEPWWRAVGFLHYPFVDWPAWFPALDVGDFVFGNFAEEIFFRGYLLTRLESSMGWWKALLGQALLFGVFHINYDLFPFHPLPMVMYVLMATVFGVLMGLLLRYSGSLLVPALVHPMANLGVLWVGVTTAGSGITWLTLPLYYTLQLVLGLVLIPLVLRAVTGRFGPPVGPERPRRSPRTIAKQWIEPRYP
jgi:membrane protease YdiL (CAAX protease family)